MNPLLLRVYESGGQIVETGLWDRRRQAVTQLFLERSPAEVEQMAGTVLRLCAQAQRVAARAACLAAAGCELEPRDLADSAPILRCAQVRDHVWQWAVNWPHATGQPPQPELSRELALLGDHCAAQASWLSTWLECELLGQQAGAWLDLSESAWDRWIMGECGAARCLRELQTLASSAPKDDCGLLPPLTQLDVAELTELACQPGGGPGAVPLRWWRGAPVQTGAWARQSAHPHLQSWLKQGGSAQGARLLARLLELARAACNAISDLKWEPAPVRALALTPGCGLAAVETARGLLLHQAWLERGRIVAYKIIAPTDWHLSAQGPLCRALRGGKAQLPWITRQVQSFDPCVELDLELVEAGIKGEFDA